MWVGVLVLGELQDGFNLRGISSDKYQIILGIAILVFMILNIRLGRLRGSGRLAGAPNPRKTPGQKAAEAIDRIGTRPFRGE
jgi:hypothetical protein